jgi:alkylated DNA repair dioxygenase AlkB
MNGIIYIENFIKHSTDLFGVLETKVEWDTRMWARKTASFGKAYNYSQIAYPYQEFLPELIQLNVTLESVIGFISNNCLINYYVNGKSKMGYHADQTDILEPGTGIAIVSLGETRTLNFRHAEDHERIMSYQLTTGSLIYMTQEIQHHWQHAIPPSPTEQGRMSLTFRKLK